MTLTRPDGGCEASTRLYHPSSAGPNFPLAADMKYAVNGCCDALREKVVRCSSYYEFEDWPMFVGVSLVWDYGICEQG